MTRGDDLRLQDMLDAARTALRGIEGKTRADLERDPILAFGLVKMIEILGEAAKNVSAATRERAPGVPWRDISRTRDRLIHGYFDVDLDRIWDTLTRDLPPLASELERLLAGPSSSR